jgi:two-component system, cell cycle sensor histidine kinase and response regulator CckA
MANNVKKQLMIRSFPPLAINRKIMLKEANLNDIIRDAAMVLRQIVRTGIETKVRLDQENLLMLADMALMEEAVVSFAMNAVDAMPNGGILTITTNLVTSKNEPGYPLRRCVSGSCAFFSVSDTGLGMDPATMERMFEPYFTTKQGEGRGLSLAIAYSIIKEHDGCIKVNSDPGKGTEVKVYLPLLQAGVDQNKPVPLLDRLASDLELVPSYGYRA